jgi:SAM-dependent methyltransferase
VIGDDIRARVFRDTKEFYASVPSDLIARQLIRFARRHAGKDILDLGCATGNYSRHLSSLGYSVKGADVNPAYVEIARSRGVDAFVVKDRLPFADRSFDTVLLFEVLEHLSDPTSVLLEAKRVARKNVLLTTPNSGGIDELRQYGLLFEHFADLDHKNFFTRETLRGLLTPHFSRVVVRAGDGINPLALFPFRAVRFVGRVATRLKLLPAHFRFRLFAVADV